MLPQGHLTTVRDLLNNPAWEAKDLGSPLPDNLHACSVCLPTWDSVIGYEEGREKVLRKLRTGYPRFFRHPTIQRLFENARSEIAADGEDVMIFPTRLASQRAHRWLEKIAETAIRSTSYHGFQAIIFPEKARNLANDYWRFTGEGISSRAAQDFLEGNLRNFSEPQKLFDEIANLTGGTPANTHIFASGISAGLAVLRALPNAREGKKTLQIEFPYVDTLKIQERLGNGVVYLNKAHGESFDEALQRIRTGEFSGVFTEIPSNPLLRTVDLQRVSEACKTSQTPLIVDDSAVGPLNVDVLHLVDVLTSSLTKWISGQGDVLAGAATVSQDSPVANELNEALALDAQSCAPLYSADAEVLLKNLQSYPHRNSLINTNAEKLAAFLKSHQAIDQVWHPSLTQTENYDSVKRHGGGYGGLLSFTLKNLKKTPKVYDSLRFSKGPSFGTFFTLVCPYTLLAHYHELNWTEDCGVSTNLLRVSVGTEESGEIISRFEEALS